MIAAQNRCALLLAAFWMMTPLACSSPSGPPSWARTKAGASEGNLPPRVSDERLMGIASTFEQQGRTDQARQLYAAVRRNNATLEEADRRLQTVAHQEQQGRQRLQSGASQRHELQNHQSPPLIAKLIAKRNAETAQGGPALPAWWESPAEQRAGVIVVDPENPPAPGSVKLRLRRRDPRTGGDPSSPSPSTAPVVEEDFQGLKSFRWSLDADPGDPSSPNGENPPSRGNATEGAVLVQHLQSEPAPVQRTSGIVRAEVVREEPTDLPDETTEESQISRLVEQLSHLEPRERALAAERLARLGANAAPALPDLRRTLMREEEASVRVRVAEAIAKIAPPDKEAVEALTNLLAESERVVRWLAASILAEVSVPEAQRPNVVAGLIERLDDREPRVRIVAALALGAFGRHAEEAVPALLDAREDDVNPEVREAASIGLANIVRG